MIRKILFSIFVSFIILWFASSYLIRNRTISLIESLNSDNFKISYEDLEMYNFPFLWKVKVLAPKITFVDRLGSTEVFFKYFNFSFSLNLKNLDVDLGSYAEGTLKSGEEEIVYTFESKGPSIVKVSFDQPLYLISKQEKFERSLNKIECKVEGITGKKDKEEYFKIGNIDSSIKKETEDSRLSFKASYEGKLEVTGFRRADIDFDILFSKGDKFKKFIADKFYLKLEDSTFSMTGSAKLEQGAFPEGKFSVDIENYDAFIEKIIPDDFIISRNNFKTMIANIIQTLRKKVPEGNAKFDLEFSSDGIKIDSINLFNIKKKK